MRTLLNWEISVTVSRPRPMRVSRSPADTAVTHRAPHRVTPRPTVPRRSGVRLSTAPITTTPHISMATLRIPASRYSFTSDMLFSHRAAAPEESPMSPPSSKSSAASGAACVNSGGSVSDRVVSSSAAAPPPNRISAANANARASGPLFHRIRISFATPR